MRMKVRQFLTYLVNFLDQRPMLGEVDILFIGILGYGELG